MSDRFSEIKEILPFEADFSLSKIASVSAEAINQLSEEEKNELKKCKSLRRQREFVASRILLKQMAAQLKGGEKLTILKDKLGQPFGQAESQKYYVSIAHTDEFVFCGLSPVQPIGVDLEPVDRPVSFRLAERITQPTEKNMMKNIAAIRLWTIKEAYMKLRGQGLRLNMNEVRIKQENEQIFAELNDDNNAKICSFRLKENWLAIAYYH